MRRRVEKEERAAAGAAGAGSSRKRRFVISLATVECCADILSLPWQQEFLSTPSTEGSKPRALTRFQEDVVWFVCPGHVFICWRKQI